MKLQERLREHDMLNGRYGVTASVADEAAAQLDLYEAALREAREALALAADIPLIDPRHSEAIAELCDRAGYGAVMSSASAQWRVKLGELAGGEFCAGPCRGTAEKAIAQIDAALNSTDTGA